jgi:large subunit ribosomal protein L9
MKVILKEDVLNLGEQGEIVKVKAGYARNYLIPQKLAVLFTQTQMKSIEEERKQENRKLETQKDKLLSVIKDIEKLNLNVKMKSEEDNKLFGSVTKIDIVKLLLEKSVEIDKKYIDLDSPIKTLGEHKVNIIFTSDIKGSLTVLVEKED